MRVVCGDGDDGVGGPSLLMTCEKKGAGKHAYRDNPRSPVQRYDTLTGTAILQAQGILGEAV